MSRTKRITATLAGLVLTATLAACADQSTTPPAATTSQTGISAMATESVSASASSDVAADHNDQDTTFAQMMIIHHEGAIEMSQLAIEQAETPEVVALAERIAEAQGPEIDEMTAWLNTWGEDVSPDDHGGMDMGGMDMNGMSQEEMMTQLDGLTGTEFDQAFLEAMIAHHEGAIEMSEQQLADGQNPDAVALAEKIIADQQAEITEMQELLTSL
ncbi:DUF305 domain-containing protein [Tessaracoccus sp. MC1679]|uniref:DUF305 domain-containing protein n=1 Tax=unclassified Tessaracoccus TaxID=2635419 RepID=UPI001604525D|nr:MULTISPECIES: DUF305 domain-containing protein [unclassified Tessaracoccus]MBB1513271.1 DUF305 domain-containing protein [Tessaracoccus sp. MC1627]MBB1517043.1 DUF305 domain-containing protein [Tessaracoccus sp. MC1679]